MELSELRILNVPKGPAGGAAAAQLPAQIAGCFVLETCQRKLLVTTRDRGSALPGALAGAAAMPARAWMRGATAFCFLLETAAGLRSAVVGETEILSQLKTAWAQLERSGDPVASELRPWIQVAVADAKEVREQFLRGTGGQSYGSLLRRVLGDLPSGPVLLLGAGDLAARVLPWLAGDSIRVWNRTPSRAEALKTATAARCAAPIEIVAPSIEAELAAWRAASLVVSCVPLDAARDAARLEHLLALPESARPRVAHLGLLAAQGTPWNAVQDLVTLDRLFEVDRRQGELRAERIGMAMRWCEARAELRALDRCVTVAHGWEDLARFTACGVA